VFHIINAIGLLHIVHALLWLRCLGKASILCGCMTYRYLHITHYCDSAVFYKHARNCYIFIYAGINVRVKYGGERVDLSVACAFVWTTQRSVICALLGYDAASSGNPLPTFQDNVSVSSSRVYPSWTSWPLKMGPIRCPEASVKDYHSTLRHTPE
jgi:hypothetical protein